MQTIKKKINTHAAVAEQRVPAPPLQIVITAGRAMASGKQWKEKVGNAAHAAGVFT